MVFVGREHYSCIPSYRGRDGGSEGWMGFCLRTTQRKSKKEQNKGGVINTKQRRESGSGHTHGILVGAGPALTL